MASQPAKKPDAVEGIPVKKAEDLLVGQAANEVVFAVVGHVGSGNSVIADTLRHLLKDPEVSSEPYDVQVLKARDVITAWANQNGKSVPSPGSDNLDDVIALQDLGDAMRQEHGDYSAVARALILRVREARAASRGIDPNSVDPIPPDGKHRAYILDSVRHPAEVFLLRRVYQEAFVLIGVVCEEEQRLDRIEDKYRNAGRTAAQEFMQRDARAQEKWGQRVADAFHLSDFFVDNSVERFNKDESPNVEWDINEHLSRLIKIIAHSEIKRPTSAETAMYHAYGAQMRSACLSRQVGAALVDHGGNVLAVGTNEAPKAGGGVYGERSSDKDKDVRCAYRPLGPGLTPYCSNTREQNRIINKLIDNLPELNAATEQRKSELPGDLRDGPIGDLLEFSRAVHAEMDALLSAGRQGLSTVGTRLFVTTFPCHYCARHIVAAGIDEVQFIEPYLKSQALSLHDDSIQTHVSGWRAPSRGGEHVLFRPFIGVAPRMYRRAFLKDRELKNRQTGNLEISEPAWGTPWHLSGTSYVQLEAELKKHETS